MAYTVFNIVWFIFFGWWLAPVFWLLGALLCCTILGIPWGKSTFKFGTKCAAPFRKPEPQPTQPQDRIIIVNNTKE